MYDKLQAGFVKIKEYDPEVAIQDGFNPKREPIRSAGDFPELGNHAKYVRHFTCDDEKDCGRGRTISRPQKTQGNSPAPLFSF